MSSLPSVSGSVALLVLQQSSASTNTSEIRKTDQASIVAIANQRSFANPTGVSVTKQPGKMQAKISADMFSVNASNLNKVKFDLFKRTGEAFGINRDDYDSWEDFGAAVKKAVAAVRIQPNGDLALMAIAKKLGLDKLGVSIDDVVDAMMNPDGKANDKLNKALEKELHQQTKKNLEGQKDKDKSETGQDPLQVQTDDDTGIYIIGPSAAV